MSTHRKPAILTLHYGFNEGAILQAQVLSRLIGAQIIDHRYPSKIAAYPVSHASRAAALRDAIAALPLAEANWSEDCLPAFRWANAHANILICGSDELWKWSKKHNPMRPPVPNAYWPDATVKIPKVAFAASIGESDPQAFSEREMNRLHEILLMFTMLGVRDQKTGAFLKRLGLTTHEHVPDPTFIVKGMKWPESPIEKIVEKLRTAGYESGGPTALVFDGGVAMGAAVRTAELDGFQILCLQRCCRKGWPNGARVVDLSRYSWSPLEWFLLPAYADFVLTHRMHGLISALVNNVPCRTLDRRNKSAELLREFSLPRSCSARASAAIIRAEWPFDKVAQMCHAYTNKIHAFADRVRDLLE